MCSMILKEAVSYYSHNGSNVYCTVAAQRKCNCLGTLADWDRGAGGVRRPRARPNAELGEDAGRVAPSRHGSG
jgi:hypothetical protein